MRPPVAVIDVKNRGSGLLTGAGIAVTARISAKLTNLAKNGDPCRCAIGACLKVYPDGLFVNDLLLRP
jgi:hypothetical protein